MASSTYTNPWAKALDEFERRYGTRILDDLVQGTRQYNALQEINKKKYNTNQLLALTPEIDLALKDLSKIADTSAKVDSMITVASNKQNPNYDPTYVVQLQNTKAKLNNAVTIQNKAVDSEKSFRKTLVESKSSDDIYNTGVDGDDVLADSLKQQVTNLRDVGQMRLASSLEKEATAVYKQKQQLESIEVKIKELLSKKIQDPQTVADIRNLRDARNFIDQGMITQGTTLLNKIGEGDFEDIPTHLKIVQGSENHIKLLSAKLKDGGQRYRLNGEPGNEHIQEWKENEAGNLDWVSGTGVDTGAADYLMGFKGPKNSKTSREIIRGSLTDNFRVHGKKQTTVMNKEKPSLGDDYMGAKIHDMSKLIPFSKDTEMSDQDFKDWQNYVGDNVLGVLSWAESGGEWTESEVNELIDKGRDKDKHGNQTGIGAIYDYYLDPMLDPAKKKDRYNKLRSAMVPGANWWDSTNDNIIADGRMEDFFGMLTQWEEANLYNTAGAHPPPVEKPPVNTKTNANIKEELNRQLDVAKANGDEEEMRKLLFRLKQLGIADSLSLINLGQ